MKQFLVFAAVALLAGWGCYHYEPQFEGPYEDAHNGNSGQTVYEILVVQDGKIHLFHRSLQFQKTLTSLPAGIKRAAINFKHDRIAYQVPGQDIVVIDSSGRQLDVIDQTSSVNSFDWHANNETLVYLDGYNLKTWGPALNIQPAMLYETLFPFTSSSNEITSAAYTASDATVAACRYYDPSFGGYESRVVVANAFGYLFYLDLISSENVEWMRSNPAGNRVFIGSRLAGSTPLRMVDATSAFYNETPLNGAPYAAPGPSGTAYAVWTGQQLSVIDSDRGIQQDIDLAGNVTALDW